MSVRRIGALLLVGALATGLAACGDDGDEGGLADVGSDEGEDSGEESSGGDESGDSGEDVDLGAFGDEECQNLIEAMAGFGAAFGGGGDDAADFGEFADVFEAIGEQAPEIEDDLAILADAYREFDDALGDADLSDPEIFQSDEFIEASEAFSGSEVTEASERVNAFFEDACGGG